MKIKSTLIGISIISALLLIVNIISFVLLVRNTEEQVQAFQTESTVWQLKEELITVSDYLTERARAYVSTGDESFYNEYMQEVNEDKTYASVIERFEQILPENLLAIIRNVQEESAQLAQVETESFEAMRSGNTQQAVNMLYDSRYFDGKTHINSYLEEFNVEIAKWIDQLSASAQKR